MKRLFWLREQSGLPVLICAAEEDHGGDEAHCRNAVKTQKCSIFHISTNRCLEHFPVKNYNDENN